MVSIPGFLLPSVREHLLQHAAPGRNGLLLPSDSDPTLHLSEATIIRRAAHLDPQGNVVRPGFGWREARRQAGRLDLDLHDLRHTGACMAGKKGASMAELMYWLGHSTPGWPCAGSTVDWNEITTSAGTSLLGRKPHKVSTSR